MNSKNLINYKKIDSALDQTGSQKDVEAIIEKSKKLQRLSLKEVAVLLNVTDEKTLDRIYNAAKWVKNAIYGNRLVIFAPLYISNLCSNECLYCAFRASNKKVSRKSLTQEEILQETKYLLKTGQKRILLVSGEAYPEEGLEYVFKSIDTIYSAQDGINNIHRININIAPLEIHEFKKLLSKNIGTYQLFQETYHIPTYNNLHLKGKKADYEYRLNAIDRAFDAGFSDVGIGILFGLYDYKYEVLAMISHIEHLEKKYGMGPHTISTPRLEPATGSDLSSHPPRAVNDSDFKKIIAILRLAVPYTGIILSTRETAKTRRESFDLGISQISAGSRTNPGGYSKQKSAEQFSLGDHRNLDEVIYDICKKGYLPSFCTGCYRLGRTGLDFMEYAKPGAIKLKCTPNAIITFLEYLEDYASDQTKHVGLQLLKKELSNLPENIKPRIKEIYQKTISGERDLYV